MSAPIPDLLNMDRLSIEIPKISLDRNTREIDTPVRGVSFRIRAGQTTALVGESGSGKSLTARAILGLLPGVARVGRGDIRFKEDSLLSMSQRRLRGIRGNRISMIFQEPMNSLNPLHTVEKQVSEVLRIHQGMGKARARERVIQLLKRVGIHRGEERLSAFPHELSGGQRQRVMLAMALANDPELLIADEPTTALDVTVARRILTLLGKLQKETGMAILIISHDLKVVADLAHEVHVMQKGRIVESGPCGRVLEQPQHPYTQSLTAAMGHGWVPSPSPGEPPVLEAENIQVSFPLKKNILGKTITALKAVDGISLSLSRGDCLGVVGESGSGKSTLAKALLGLIPFSGEVRVKGRAMAGLDRTALTVLRRRLQIVFQDPFASLNPRMTIGDIVQEGPRAMGSVPDKAGMPAGVTELTQWALEKVGLSPDLAPRWPHELSGGQRQRVAIARAMVMAPDLIILDEPTSSLDRNLQFQILDLLGRLQAEFNMAYLFITHDLDLVKGFCNRVMILNQGQCVETGKTAALFSAPETEYARKLLGTK